MLETDVTGGKNEMCGKKKKSKMTGLSIVGFTGWKGGTPLETLEIFFESCQCAYERVRYGFCFRDTWEIDTWFMKVMPGMLTYLRDNRNGSPILAGKEDGAPNRTDDGADIHEAWTKELNKLIFLLNEMNENTCRRKNPYQEEYDRCMSEFSEKYGSCGEKLCTEEELEKDRKEGTQIYHFMSELPEYKNISDAYWKEEDALFQYREKCKDGFFRLFSKYFHNLWD